MWEASEFLIAVLVSIFGAVAIKGVVSLWTSRRRTDRQRHVHQQQPLKDSPSPSDEPETLMIIHLTQI